MWGVGLLGPLLGVRTTWNTLRQPASGDAGSRVLQGKSSEVLFRGPEVIQVHVSEANRSDILKDSASLLDFSPGNQEPGSKERGLLTEFHLIEYVQFSNLAECFFRREVVSQLVFDSGSDQESQYPGYRIIPQID